MFNDIGLMYILDKKGNPKKCKSIGKWGKFVSMEGSREVIKTKIGKVLISTVFLALDHNYGGSKKPVLYETMIFNSRNKKLYEYQERYCTKEEALKGHKKAVLFVNKILKK